MAKGISLGCAWNGETVEDWYLTWRTLRREDTANPMIASAVLCLNYLSSNCTVFFYHYEYIIWLPRIVVECNVRWRKSHGKWSVRRVSYHRTRVIIWFASWSVFILLVCFYVRYSLLKVCRILEIFEIYMVHNEQQDANMYAKQIWHCSFVLLVIVASC